MNVARGPAKKAKHSIGVAMAGGNPKAGRHTNDFYATPSEVTVALLRRLRPDGPVWEPFCGDGAIAKVLTAHGVEVVATDLVDRGYGGHGGGHDILASKCLLAPNVVSNPPFDIAPDVIDHVMAMQPAVLALLLKSTFWQAKRRLPLFRRHRPSAVYALSWRPDFADKGAPTMECSWVVWDGSGRDTVFDVLDRPLPKTLYDPIARPGVKTDPSDHLRLVSCRD
jgi:hypothetical protein